MSAGDLKKFALFVEFTEEDRTALDALLEPETITAGGRCSARATRLTL